MEHREGTANALDRVFCNKEWDLMHVDYQLQALSSSLSDHCPLFVFHQEKPTVKDTFRFEIFWPQVPGFKEVVQEAWNEVVPGVSPLNILVFQASAYSGQAEAMEQKATQQCQDRASHD
jgi:hypothetical protein